MTKFDLFRYATYSRLIRAAAVLRWVYKYEEKRMKLSIKVGLLFILKKLLFTLFFEKFPLTTYPFPIMYAFAYSNI